MHLWTGRGDQAMGRDEEARGSGANADGDGTSIMKQPKTLIKELRQELRYYQTMARVDARALRAAREKCKQIGAKMRKLQMVSK